MKSKIAYRVVAAVVIIASIPFVFMRDDGVPPLLKGVVVDPPQPLQTIRLVDHLNNPVSRERFVGRWTFLLFGYMSCPDVCPTTLMQLKTVKRAITQSDHALDEPLQVVFISVDPERDTTERLAEYVAFFDPAFVGITGDLPDIGAFEEQVGAFHRYGSKDPSGFYTVQHSADVFLIDPAARVEAKFEPPMNTQRVSQQFALLAERYETSLN